LRKLEQAREIGALWPTTERINVHRCWTATQVSDKRYGTGSSRDHQQGAVATNLRENDRMDQPRTVHADVERESTGCNGCGFP